MNNISNFFQKFLKFEKDNALKLSLILDSVKRVAGLELSKEMIKIEGDRLKLKCSPVFRNEIFMHKSEIENSLRSQKIFLDIV